MIEPQAAKRGITRTLPSVDQVVCVDPAAPAGSGGSVIVQYVACGADHVRIYVKERGAACRRTT